MSENGCSQRKKKIIGAGAAIAGLYTLLQWAAHKQREPQETDSENVFICQGQNPEKKIPKSSSVYEEKVKPLTDKILSFTALIILFPLFAIISLAIYIDDPGPVFFTQNRVGKDKKLFALHKFRSMKVSTPHDVPTHLLENPEQYITNVGKFLRRTSLDELPQIWDIFRGKMSIIGPRPALWNQHDLIAEREKYGANDVMPGLTGWAQINGRDELEIRDKAQLDGAYTVILHSGSLKGFAQDVKCFVRTVTSVVKSEGVVEGGTGEIQKVQVYGSGVSREAVKSILIAGADSYIGKNIKRYLENSVEDYYQVDFLDTVGLKPETSFFKGYDVVINVAGIAHMKETKNNRHLYYKINRDLAVNIAKAAKAAGVRQFIQLSSMSVYGMTTGFINKATVPHPSSAYGDSKLQADQAIEQMEDNNFRVVILRPPMVYGKACRGNYQVLRKFALKSPVFPACENKRSMIYIGNLCEFMKRIIDKEDRGLFFPQNKEYVNVADMVKLISQVNGNRIVLVKPLYSAVRFIPVKTFKKVFGNLIYEQVDTIDKYQFNETIEITEG